jgi:BirA family biotin operon repressor/biotin-[acetyl-CoA-carboxylase] ligase
MPEELRTIATSLRIEGGRTFDRSDLAATVLTELDAAYGRLRRGDFHEISDEWMRRCSTLGQRVTIRMADRVVVGRAESLNEDGALLVRTDHGRLEHIIGGDVSLAKGPTP